MATFTLTNGIDNFTGTSGELNIFNFTPTTLAGTDTITGIVSGTFLDVLQLTAGGTVTAAQFAGVTNIEQLLLSTAGNNVTLTNGLVAGSSAGSFVVIGAAGNDRVDASGVTNGMPIVFSGNGGNDTFIGSSVVNISYFNASDLTAADTVTGGVGTDTIVITSAGTLAASAFTNVTGIETLYLNTAGNNVTLTNGLVAGSSAGSFVVIGAAGNDTVDASGVTNGMPIVFSGNGGNDTFVGSSGVNISYFSASDLTAADTVTGGVGTDTIVITSGGTLAASAFTNVTGIETLYLNTAGNNVTLTNGLVAGASAGSFGVVGAAGNDTVDASGVTNGMPIVFSGNGGNDTFVGSSVVNISYFNASDLTAADTVTGGVGTDTIVITSAGTLAASAFTNVTGIEALYLMAGNNVTLTNELVAGASAGSFGVVGAAGNDTIDASGVTNSVSVAFYGNGGTDNFTGHGATDTFVTAAADLGATDVFEGNGGNDVLLVTTNGAIAAASHVGVTEIELVQLQSGGSFQFADNLASASQLLGIGTSAVDSFDGSLVTAYGLVLTGAGGADTMVGGGQDDEFRIPDSSFVQIDGNGGLDRIVLTAPAQVFSLTANAAKITDVEVISLASSAGASLTLAAADIPQINSSGNSLYIVGDTDDQVNAGSGWVLISTAHTNAAVAPGVTFVQYHHVASNAELYVADQIALTIEVTTPTVATSAFAPSFTEDGAPTAVDTGFTVSDLDDTNLESASVSITGGLQAGDVLGFTSQFGIVDTNAAPEVLALSGSATLAQWETVLRSITFSTTSQAPGTSRTVSITVNDGDTDSAAVAKVITVTPVNDAPAGTDNTVTTTEGTPYTLTAADFGFTDTDANALLAVTITTLPGSGTLANNGTPVIAGASIPAADIVAGLLVYTPPAGTGSPSFTFQVQDDGGVANGGVDLDQTANTLTISITPPNAAPVANNDTSDATEAGGLNNALAGVDPTGNVVTGVGTGSVADTDAEDPSTALVVVAVGTGAEGQPDNGTVGSFFSGTYGQLRLMADGSYEYQVNQTNALVQGLHTSADTLQDVFHYTIEDTGGAPDTASFTITIHGANDLPQAIADTGNMMEESGPTSFPVRANDTLDPDNTAANTISITGTVTATGPAGTAINNGDATAVVVGNDIQVTLNADFQQLAVTETATVTVPYTLTGDAGDSSTANLVVTVNGANDVPIANDDTGSMSENDAATLFNVRLNDTLDVDHTALNNITIGTVTASGPAGDGITGADVTTAVVANQVQITLGADFQNLGTGESATIDVPYTLTGDQPGDTDTATLQVTVNGVNDAPVAGDFTFNGANAAIGNTALVVNDASDGPPDPTGPQKTITGDLLAGATDVDTPLSSLTITPATITNASGTLIIEADGDFTYLPAAGFTDNAVFNYTLNDNDPSGNLTDTGQITINVATPRVWYVNPNAATNGDGTSDNPFNTLTQLNGVTGDGTTNDDVDGANDIIFIYGGTLSGGIVLEDGQQLIGQSQGLTVNGTALEGASGGNPLINGAVVLAAGNTIDGINIGNTGSSSVFALSGVNVGNAVFTDGLINNTSGGAININGSGTGMNLQFTSVSSTGSSTNAISFNEARGTFNAGSGTLSNAGGNTVNITGNSSNDDLNFTYGGALNDDGNLLVNITGQTGGTKDFNGLLTDGSGAGGGISLTNNTGATIRFDGGMSLNTTTSAGFTATGGGTVAVTDPAGVTTNTIVTTTGTALNVANTTIHADDLTFQSISANGAVNGIVLNTTGALGGLHVTGDGGGTNNGSGGTIQNSTGAGISLTNTTDVSLSHMNIQNGGDDGIRGSSVNGFTLNRSNITNNGNAVGERGIDMTQLSGSGGISNSTISGSAEHNVIITNDTANLTAFNVTNTAFSTTSFVTGDDGFQVLNTGSASMTVSVTGSTFTDNKGDHFQAATDADATGPMNITFNNNTLNTTAANDPNIIGGGITINTSGSTDITFQVNNNNIQQAFDDAININLDPGSQVGASMNGTISGNTIGTAGQDDSGSESSNAITVASKGQGTTAISVTNNVINEWGNGFGIFVGTTEGSSDVNALVSGNTVKNGGTFALNAIRIDAGATAANGGDDGLLEVTLTGNDVTNSMPGVIGAGEDIRLRERFETTIKLPGYAGANNDTAAVNAFVAANNDPAGATPAPSVSSVENVAGGGGGFIGGPDLLMAAPGGVEAAAGGMPGGVLTVEVLATLADAAVARWATTGLSVNQLATLEGITITVADLAGDNLGYFEGGQIVVDSDAAGQGWFIDETPQDDREFGNVLDATHLQTDPTGAPAGDMDLLTVLMHEMGHALGLDHDQADLHDLMSDTLVVGERRLPDAADVAQAQQETAVATAQAAEAVLPAAAQAPAGSPMVAGADSFVFAPAGPAVALDPKLVQVTEHVKDAVAQAPAGSPMVAGADSFVFARAGPAVALDPKLVQVTEHVKDASADLLDALHGEHPLSVLAAQLHDGPLGDLLHLVLQPHSDHHHADWLL